MLKTSGGDHIVTIEQAEWKILPKAIDLIANGKVSVLDGLTVIKE